MPYFWKAKGPSTSKMIFWTLKYANTQIEFLKYTNTAYQKVPEIPNICYIFEKQRVQGHKKWYSWLQNTQIQNHKYTNTAYETAVKEILTQHMLYFWKARGPRTSKMIFCTVKYTKYKNPNLQIQHMTKCKKYPIYAICLTAFGSRI